MRTGGREDGEKRYGATHFVYFGNRFKLDAICPSGILIGWGFRGTCYDEDAV